MDAEDPNVQNGLGALYRISGRYRWLNWMRKPGGETMMDFVAVGTLFGGMAINCAAEMQERKRARMQATQPKAEKEDQQPMQHMPSLREQAAAQGA